MAQPLEPAASGVSSRLAVVDAGACRSEAQRRDVGEVHDAMRVLDRIERGDRQHALRFFRQRLGMFGGVVVNALGERFQVRAELGSLLAEPLGRTAGDAVGPDPLVAGQIRRTEVLRRAAARFTVKMQQQIAVTLRLRPAVAVEEIFGRSVRRRALHRIYPKGSRCPFAVRPQWRRALKREIE